MDTVGDLVADRSVLVFARFAVTAFFALIFLQSGLNKFADSDGNIAYFQEQFKQAPSLQGIIGPLFWALAALELAAGGVGTLGVVTLSFASGGFLARWGLGASTVALLCLTFGQRMAKDYAGAAVLAGYFAVAMTGLLAFAIGK